MLDSGCPFYFDPEIMKILYRASCAKVTIVFWNGNKEHAANWCEFPVSYAAVNHALSRAVSARCRHLDLTLPTVSRVVGTKCPESAFSCLWSDYCFFI